MVLPKPWQRGQAPAGLLKLNRIGSGSRNSRLSYLHMKRSLKSWRSPVRGIVEDRVAGFAIADFDRIDDALMQIGRRWRCGRRGRKTGCSQSMSSSDSGVENSNIAPFCHSRLKPRERSSVRTSLGIWPASCFTGKSTRKRSPCRLLEHPLRDLIDRVLLDAPAANRAECASRARPEQPHEVVDLGRSGDGGSRIARGVLLADGDGRRDAVDLVDLRLLHALEKLPRVSGEGFDVAPLSFRVDRVEGERGFAGTGHARDDGELVVRDREREVLEIVEACATDNDFAETGLRAQRNRMASA